jgi:hypothetical protein
LFTKNKMAFVSHHPIFFLFRWLQIKLKGRILTQLRWSKQNHRRRWTPSLNTTSRMHLQNAEALETVHTRRRGLFWVWWWPAGLKLICHQMAAPVLEIIGVSLYNCRWASPERSF